MWTVGLSSSSPLESNSSSTINSSRMNPSAASLASQSESPRLTCLYQPPRHSPASRRVPSARSAARRPLCHFGLRRVGQYFAASAFSSVAPSPQLLKPLCGASFDCDSAILYIGCAAGRNPRVIPARNQKTQLIEVIATLVVRKPRPIAAARPLSCCEQRRD